MTARMISLCRLPCIRSLLLITPSNSLILAAVIERRTKGERRKRREKQRNKERVGEGKKEKMNKNKIKKEGKMRKKWIKELIEVNIDKQNSLLQNSLLQNSLLHIEMIE